MSVSSGVAALPVSAVVESVSLRVSLDRVPTFLPESDVGSLLDEMATSDDESGWFTRVWKPAGVRVAQSLPVDAVG